MFLALCATNPRYAPAQTIIIKGQSGWTTMHIMKLSMIRPYFGHSEKQAEGNGSACQVLPFKKQKQLEQKRQTNRNKQTEKTNKQTNN